MQNNIFTKMRSVKMMDGCKGTQVYALNSSSISTGGGGGGGGSAGEKFLHHLQDHLRVNSIRSKSCRNFPNVQTVNNSAIAEALMIYGLPETNLIEPQIESCLKSVNFVETLADVYRRIESCPQFEKSGMYLEQCVILWGLPDPKLFRRSLRAARQHAVDIHWKIVLSAWLRYERREDELIGTSSMDCCGQNIECTRAALVSGYNPEAVYDPCMCLRSPREEEDDEFCMGDEECSTSEEDCDMSFWIGDEEIRCNRYSIASLSRPFKAMLYGNFIESRREKINFSHNGISVKGMRAAEIFSRTKSVDSFDPDVVLDLLSLANKFCCEEMKSACDAYLASLVFDMERAMLLIEYGLAETAHLLVAACLQVFLRDLTSSMHNLNVMRLLCSSEARERLALVGHASFLLYKFLSQVAMEDDMKSNTTVMLLERLGECATEGWQKQLAFHQLGCVMLERKEYEDAQNWFEAAVEAGHIYSLVGVARAKYKRGHKFSAYKLMNSLISDYTPSGWMYQERSVYCDGKEKMMDLDTATKLDPTLSYPYRYRAVSMLEENKIGAAIAEMDKIITFRVSPNCLEMRAWFLVSLEDYEGALRDVRAILTLDPSYMMFHGKLHGDHLVELLRQHVQQWSQADCWMQLYDRWSSVDDIGSLAVVHHMLENDPGKSLLWFRQSLLLLRLNCHKAAMRSLWLARNHATSEHERLVYEGWISYDTGHREEALAKAVDAISIQRSFEAYFLKAYALTDPDSNLDPESSSYVIELLEEALRCPSDGLRKGQALSNLGSIYVDCGKLDLAADCYMNALNIKHSRAHQGLARVYHLKNQRKAAYDEMTKLIEKARYNASAYEKRSEYCDRDMAKSDLSMATQLDPLRTYPYRYRAAVLMDDHKEAEAIAELTKAIAFKPDLQLLHLRAAFHDSMGDYISTLRDCEAALCLDPRHADTLELYHKTLERANEQQSTEDEAAVAVDRNCPRELNFNAPFLSTRRPGGGVEMSRANSQGDSRDACKRIPFSWEQIPGKPKDMDNVTLDMTVPPPKLPPARWHPPKEAIGKDNHDEGCDGDIDDDYDSFSDAIDMFSLSEAIDMVEPVRQTNLLRGASFESEFTSGTQSPSFIIQRFLPDAKALAASSALALSKNTNNNVLRATNYPERCVSQAVRQSCSSPKGCGLDIFFPWRMKHRPCGARSPVQAPALNLKPQWGIREKQNRSLAKSGCRSGGGVDDSLAKIG